MNNRIENLRDVTTKENQHNQRNRSDSTSGFPGVSFSKACGKYRSQIQNAGNNIYLGLFNTPEEAFLAYQLAKIEHHPTSPIAQEYLRELTLAG